MLHQNILCCHWKNLTATYIYNTERLTFDNFDTVCKGTTHFKTGFVKIINFNIIDSTVTVYAADI